MNVIYIFLCRKYGMKVIVDLHAVQASQNGNDHSATRDGYQEWGESNIQETVAVIDFLAERFNTSNKIFFFFFSRKIDSPKSKARLWKFP
jgi:aryl-phospho-beta-D-glucosidase BglC (GH1 family)